MHARNSRRAVLSADAGFLLAVISYEWLEFAGLEYDGQPQKQAQQLYKLLNSVDV